MSTEKIKILYTMKKVIILLAVVLAMQLSYSQEPDSTVVTPAATVQATPDTKTGQPVKERKDTRPLKERISFGFGTAFWINTSQTYLELNPALAYRFPKTLVTGVGYRYIWRHDRDYDENLHSYGPTLFARVDMFKRIYMWTEYEILTTEYEIQDVSQAMEIDKATIDSWFAGIGYIKSFGKKGRGGLSIQVLYNILYYSDDRSPYYSPVIYRVGYYF
jgi:hypothetical protein